MIETNYLESVLKQFRYYKLLAEKTFEQLDTPQLFYRQDISENSIAIIVHHLWGNMLSRWTEFLTSDGEKTWRERDLEFEDEIKTRVDLLQKWEEGWHCLFNALEPLATADFNTVIYIRNQGHTVVEAINRQLAHYAYHIGQIVFIGKMLQRNKWQSLSIPKGTSESYNSKKFSEEKKIVHFTDEYVTKKKTMTTSEENTVRIYTGAPILAEALVGRLKELDIIPIVKEDQQSGVMFGNAPNLSAQVQVFIRQDELPQAKPAIDSFNDEINEGK